MIPKGVKFKIDPRPRCSYIRSGGCNQYAEYKLSAGFGTSLRCFEHADSKYINSMFYDLVPL